MYFTEVSHTAFHVLLTILKKCWADAIKLELDELMAEQTLHFPKGEVEQEELREDIKSNDYKYACI